VHAVLSALLSLSNFHCGLKIMIYAFAGALIAIETVPGLKASNCMTVVRNIVLFL